MGHFTCKYRVKIAQAHRLKTAQLSDVKVPLPLTYSNSFLTASAGRAIKSFSTSNKQKIVIKNTLFYYNHDNQEQEKYDTIFSLLDTIIAGCSGKQCEVIYYKLLGYSEKEISQKLDKSQSTISQHSTAAGWQSIERSVNYFEKNIIQ